MQKYNKYTRWKNYLTANSVLRVIFFVKILFLKVSFRKTTSMFMQYLHVENKLCITKTRDQHPFIGRGQFELCKAFELEVPLCHRRTSRYPFLSRKWFSTLNSTFCKVANNSRLLQVAIRRLNFLSPSITPKMSQRHLKYPSNPQKPVQSLAICTKKRKKPLLIHCHIRKTPYLCTRFPKGSTKRDL